MARVPLKGLGTTPNGIDWCVKALHPSDPITEVRGIPDKDAMPTLMMNYQSVYTLSPAAGSTGTWSFNASLLPNPVSFMFVSKTDTASSTTVTNYHNSQLEGASQTEKFTSLREFAQRWRLAYMAVTVIQDGPDLANQGTITVCQAPLANRVRNVSFTDGVDLFAVAPLATWTAEDYPSFDSSQSMPNAYFNKSKEGAYVPLKLTRTCQKWSSEADAVFCTSATQEPIHGVSSLPTSSGSTNFPLVGERFYFDVSGPSYGGELFPGMCNDVVAHICARNLAVTTSFSFFVRAGYEMQVVPTSILAPQLKLSPPHDSRALQAYFAIARELKDAYPADYNDLGKIWDVISGIAHRVAPFLSTVPFIGSVLPSVVKAAASVGDLIREKTRNPSSGEVARTVSSADLERMRAVPRQITIVRKSVAAQPRRLNVQRKQ